MTDATAISPAPTGAARPAPRRSAWLCLGGALSVLLFFVPLWAPLIQLATLVAAICAARRGTADRVSWVVGTAGAGIGLLLSLILEYLFVV